MSHLVLVPRVGKSLMEFLLVSVPLVPLTTLSRVLVAQVNVFRVPQLQTASVVIMATLCQMEHAPHAPAIVSIALLFLFVPVANKDTLLIAPRPVLSAQPPTSQQLSIHQGPPLSVVLGVLSAHLLSSVQHALADTL